MSHTLAGHSTEISWNSTPSTWCRHVPDTNQHSHHSFGNICTTLVQQTHSAAQGQSGPSDLQGAQQFDVLTFDRWQSTQLDAIATFWRPILCSSRLTGWLIQCTFQQAKLPVARQPSVDKPGGHLLQGRTTALRLLTGFGSIRGFRHDHRLSSSTLDSTVLSAAPLPV